MSISMIEKESIECIKDYWSSLGGMNSGRPGHDKQATFWDMRADNYARNVSNDTGNKNVAAVIELLGSAGFVPNGKSVLDIGCGPGTLALPLARMGAKVTALDISASMLQKLEEKAKEENLASIKTVHASWHDADLNGLGFRKKFDLVIASMTPAVSDVRTLDKMMVASRGLCYYSGFLNRQWDIAYYDLHRALFNEEFKDMVTGFYVPFMYLYARGYRPIMRLYKDVWSTDDTIEEMAETIYGFFGQRKEPGEGARDVIKKYLAERSNNGTYHAETNVVTGIMAWDVSKK